MPLPRSPGRLSLRRLAPRAEPGKPFSFRQRLGMLAIGIAVIVYGVAKFESEPAGIYSNYWGGQVFAPVVILAGAIAVVGAFVVKRDPPSAGRRDKPVEFPHETVEKPW